MFGSLQINGNKITRPITLDKAEHGFLVITSKASNSTWDVGDLLFKSKSLAGEVPSVTNITKAETWVPSEIHKSLYTIAYIDIEIGFKPVAE
jgi:uncharacterized protein with ACT and thioredoxin-like domain